MSTGPHSDLAAVTLALLERSGPVSGARLHALLYFAQGSSLAVSGSVLYESDIVADAAGPRVADLPIDMDDEVVAWAHEGQSWHTRCPVAVTDPDMAVLLGHLDERSRVQAVFANPERTGSVRIVGSLQRRGDILHLAGFAVVGTGGLPGPDLVFVESVDSIASGRDAA